MTETTKETRKMTHQRDTRHADYDPADYKVLGIFDAAPVQGGGWLYLDDEVSTGRTNWWGFEIATDEFEEKTTEVPLRCAHCGKTSGFRFLAYVLHLPTGELLFHGSGCVADAFAMDKAELKAKELGKAAAIREAREAWTAQYPEAAAALDAYEASGEFDRFLDDLSRARRLYGSLTERQSVWPVKAWAKVQERLARIAEREAALAEVAPLAEGRYVIAGTVVSTKWQESDYGSTLKMLVEMTDGNRVYGTVPAALDIEKGDAVEFTATVERSRDDDHFGFYKRPSKARRVEA